ncbi:MAG TPA: hypothetical protein VIJ51_10015 [Solirubrobacteraceae bacterium]
MLPPPAAEANVARLLLKAVETLEPEERAAVLESLVGLALAPTDPAGFAPILGPAQARQVAFTARMGGAPPAAGQRMFPVRLPERDHGRLKAWCDGHNFSMAVVVRGLIERFLDQQEPAPAD